MTHTNLFNLAKENAEKYMAMTLLQRKQLRDEKREASKRRVYLKIPFHPSDPPRRLLQKMWRNLVSNPPGRLPLNQLHTNNLIEDGVLATVPIDQLIIAYRRAPNMGNLYYHIVTSRNARGWQYHHTLIRHLKPLLLCCGQTAKETAVCHAAKQYSYVQFCRRIVFEIFSAGKAWATA